MRRLTAAKGYLIVSGVLLLTLLFAAGCAKKRRTPSPPPAARPAPTVSTPRIPPPPSSTATPSNRVPPGPPLPQRPAAPAPAEPDFERGQIELIAPPGCTPDEVVPWFRCFHESPNSRGLVYYLFLPPSIPADETVPILTFLHGASGKGPGDGKPLQGGHRASTELWIREDIQSRYPSIVLVPQADPPRGETWVRAWRPPPPGDSRPKEALVLVMEILEALQARYPIDAKRRYLTGQSMGGFGAWLAYTRYPGYFAAIVPVCGGGDPSAVVPNPTAVWAFHGARDRVVPVRRTREMLAAIRAAGGEPQYREFPRLGHNIFDESYAEPGLVDWIFTQRLRQ